MKYHWEKGNESLQEIICVDENDRICGSVYSALTYALEAGPVSQWSAFVYEFVNGSSVEKFIGNYISSQGATKAVEERLNRTDTRPL